MRFLLSLSSNPFNPTNGAIRSMRTVAELMALAGHEVHCAATTSTLKAQPNITLPEAEWNRSGDQISGVYRKVSYRLLDTSTFRREQHKPIDLAAYKADIILCLSERPRDQEAYRTAQRAGAKIVYGLRGYNQKPFDFCDGVITSSRFFSDWYKARFGVDSTPLPLPIWPEDVIAPKHEPHYFTAINASREKGSMVIARIFGELSRSRPDLPLLIVQSRGDAGALFRAAHSIGYNLSGRVQVEHATRNPKEIFARTKVLLVPSLWEEPAGRVIAEAMMNGIPPIISGRGGMTEISNDGAYILPLPASITPQTQTPVDRATAQPWIDLIIGLHENKPNTAGKRPYEDWARPRALEAAKVYRAVTPLYEAYFHNLLPHREIAEIKAEEA